MKWYGIYNAATGELISTESDDVQERNTDEELDKLGLRRVEIAHNTTVSTQWDKATKTLVLKQ